MQKKKLPKSPKEYKKTQTEPKSTNKYYTSTKKTKSAKETHNAESSVADKERQSAKSQKCFKSLGVVIEHRGSEAIGQVAFLVQLLTLATQRHMVQPGFSCHL